jgi:hypothetical protein
MFKKIFLFQKIPKTGVNVKGQKMCQVDYQRLSFVGHFVLKSPELVCVHAN